MAASDYGPSISTLLEDVYSSVQFLTRVPVPEWTLDEPRPLSSAMWAFPLIGVLVASAAALAYAVFEWLGFPVAVSALAAVTVCILVTGGLHEDGLADFADGALGAYSPRERLAIMADSRIGTFGALALIVSVTGRTASIAAIGDPAMVLGSLVAAAAVSRAVMPPVMAILKPAREGGLGASAGTPAFGVWIGGLALATAIVVLAAPHGWFGCLVAAVAGAVVVLWVSHRLLDGYTGDSLGAVQQTSELFALALIASAVQSSG